MARILAVGNATLDIINHVENYPKEDQEVRALSQQRCRGGNATNSLVVLSQLGHDGAWAGTLAAEPDAETIKSDLQKYHIDLSAVHTVDSGKVPTSYISLSRSSGSRTIVHFRDLPEYHYDRFAGIDLQQFDWIHFEGRNLEQVKKMLERVRREYPQLPCSLEAEKPREGIEQLFPFADLLMFSREFAEHRGYGDSSEFLRYMSKQGLSAQMSCTWGENGAHGLNRQGEILHAPAFSPEKVVDTLGAGDAFNAGLIGQLVQGADLQTALTEASRLAGKKCGIYGLQIRDGE